VRVPALGLVFALWLAAAASAHAAPVRPHGPAGVVPPHTAAFGPMTRAVARGQFSPVPPGGTATVSWHGGPVMHTTAVYTIFWQPASLPSGVSAFPTGAHGYQTTVNDYYTDVAADSGKPSNVFSVDPQYTDGSGAAQYSDTFGGTYLDTSAYPANDCTDGDGAGHNTPVCFTDADLQSEVQKDVAAKGWPTGLGALYVVFTPQGVGNCFDTNAADGCAYFAGGYCAYHGSIGSGTSAEIYANLPYGATFTLGGTSVPGCEDGARPNASTAGPAIDSASHEQSEAVTDPLVTGWGSWWDSYGTSSTNAFYGSEIGDLCVDYPAFSDWYGSVLTGSAAVGSAGAANQAIGATLNPSGYDGWLLQQEWSQAAGGCLQRVPSASFTTSASPVAGSPVSFDGSGSSASSGHAGDPVTIASWSWSFGDGGTATGAAPSHTFCSPGTHNVTLTVTDSAGDPATVTQPVVVGGSPACVSTTTTLGSSANPSSAGAQVTYTATVAPAPAGGTVAFTDGGTAIAGCGAQPVNASSGTSTCAVTYPNAGSHTITAAYSGDANDQASQSTPVTQTVDPIATTGGGGGGTTTTSTSGSSTGGSPGSGGGPAPPSGDPVFALSVRQSGRSIALGSLSCPAGCVLTARAQATVPPPAGRRVRSTRTTIGTLSVTVLPGRRAALRLALSRTGRALLHRRHRVSVTVSVLLTGPTGTRTYVRRLTLRG
jgi:Bacterial Ig-like domain (group 3)/PKD domain